MPLIVQGILGNMDAVVKPGRGQKYFHRETFDFGKFPSIEDDPADVFQIMGWISRFNSGFEDGRPV